MTDKLSELMLQVLEVANEDGQRNIEKNVLSLIKRHSKNAEVRAAALNLIRTKPVSAPVQQRRGKIELTPEHFKKKGFKPISMEKRVVTREPYVEPKVSPTTTVLNLEKQEVIDQRVNMFTDLLGLTDTQLVDKFETLKGLRNFANDVLGLGLSKNSSKVVTIEAVRNEMELTVNSNSDEEE